MNYVHDEKMYVYEVFGIQINFWSIIKVKDRVKRDRCEIQ
jgi:hypothetical protein